MTDKANSTSNTSRELSDHMQDYGQIETEISNASFIEDKELRDSLLTTHKAERARLFFQMAWCHLTSPWEVVSQIDRLIANVGATMPDETIFVIGEVRRFAEGLQRDRLPGIQEALSDMEEPLRYLDARISLLLKLSQTELDGAEDGLNVLAEDIEDHAAAIQEARRKAWQLMAHQVPAPQAEAA